MKRLLLVLLLLAPTAWGQVLIPPSQLGHCADTEHIEFTPGVGGVIIGACIAKPIPGIGEWIDTLAPNWYLYPGDWATNEKNGTWTEEA